MDGVNRFLKTMNQVVLALEALFFLGECVGQTS